MAQRNSNKKIYCNSNKVLSKVLSPFILLLIINILLVSCGLDPASGSRDVTALALEKEKSEVLAKIRYNDCTALANASAALREDKEFMLAAVKKSGFALKYASEALRADREVVLAAELEKEKGEIAQVHYNTETLANASATLRGDKEFVLAANLEKEKAALLAEINSNILLRDTGSSFSSLLKDYNMLMLAALDDHSVSEDFYSTISAIKNQGDLIFARIWKNASAFGAASPALKEDRDVVLASVQNAALQLMDVSESLRNDKEIVLAAIEGTDLFAFTILKILSEKPIEKKIEKVKDRDEEYDFDTQSFYRAQIETTNRYFEDVSAGLRADRDVVLAAVKKCGFLLEYASEALQADNEVVLAAVKESGEAFFCASEALQADNEVILAAVSKISKIQNCSDFYRKILQKIHKTKFWESKENRIALLQSVHARNKEKLLRCIRQLEKEEKLEVEPISKVELNTPIAAVGVSNSPIVNIHEYTSQQPYYTVTFGTLAGQQYTISIPVDATIDLLAREMRLNLNIDRAKGDKKQYWHIACGDKRISPLQAADLLNTIFN